MNVFALPRALITHIPSLIIRYEGIRSPQNITCIHHTNDMLIGQDEQEGANMLEAQDPTSWAILFSFSLGLNRSFFFKANSFICLLKKLVLLIILFCLAFLTSPQIALINSWCSPLKPTLTTLPWSQISIYTCFYSFILSHIIIKIFQFSFNIHYVIKFDATVQLCNPLEL